MVKFLISRPIAVTMTFLAIIVLGVISMGLLPVSLMPDVNIPRISVQVSKKDASARELENTVVKTLRMQLMQVAHLADIQSTVKDGRAIIQLDFNYGTDIDFAFIEVNEKIDRGMSTFPKNIERPKVIKASITDLPVFYLNISLKSPIAHSGIDTFAHSPLFPVSASFMELSNFADQIIKKRIEQLPQVAIADISGLVFSELLIIPNTLKLQSTDIKLIDIENALHKNNVNIGNISIQDGLYRYDLRVGNKLITKEDISKVYIKKNNKLYQIKDLAEIILHPAKQKGFVVSDGNNALTLAIIKQSDARMKDLKQQINLLIIQMKDEYPEINFKLTRDQTKLLDYSISNLFQSLIFGAVFAFLLMFFFLRDFKSPILIGITIPASLVISLLLFYIAGISINIISLSGLVLGIGMMIDNSIIVIDNINQFRVRGVSLNESCISGTNEVFRPLLSSVLTTCAVFIPLVFIDGVAGTLFYDQAIAVSIGLFVSLFVTILLLPVYYKFFYSRWISGNKNKGVFSVFSKINYLGWYESWLRLTLRNQKTIWTLVILMIFSSIILYKYLDKSKFPELTTSETLLYIDWNEAITLDNNNRKVNLLVNNLAEYIKHHTTFIGEQQFLLNASSIDGAAECLLYIKTNNQAQLKRFTIELEKFMQANYPAAIYSFEDAGNMFNLIFADDKAVLQGRLKAKHNLGFKKNEKLNTTINSLIKEFPALNIKPLLWKEYIVLKTDPKLLALYNISFEEVYRTLKTSFRENRILLIADDQAFIPVVLGNNPKNLSEIIHNTFVTTRDNKQINLSTLLVHETNFDLKTIISGKEGEYFPIQIDIKNIEVPKTIELLNRFFKNNPDFEISYSGAWFTNKSLAKNMVVILGISLLLLYFILASQFESLSLPLIVLLEVPIDIFGALLFLKLFGASINIMSMIGIIVMSGIIINDSILKIDTINRLMAEGTGLLRAIIIAGQRRLKPILMTSLTTIFALLPFLFVKGMGSDLQRPLAYTVIGGMLVGTLVSLYFVPLCYYYLMRRKS